MGPEAAHDRHKS